jgi:SAM-dependent methyltransferase
LARKPGSKKDSQTAFAERLAAALAAGTTDHYLDAALYDHEYRRRRDDVRHYGRLAEEIGGPVLDLGCGTGRLLLPLLREGIEVVGVDASEPMLRRCRERLAQAGKHAQLHRGDFRRLALGRRFPLVVCAFNTFMHLYERTDVERFLAVVRKHLAPDGVFAFDVMHPDLKWLSRDPEKRWARTRFRHPTTGEPQVYSTSLTYDAALQIAFMRIFYEPAGTRAGRGSRRRELVVHLAHRYFYPRELEALLHYNGFVVERHDGDFAGTPLEPESDQQVLRCRLAPSRK